MAMASEDIWQKFDLSCAEKLDLPKMDIDMLMETVDRAPTRKQAERHEDMVPDIIDILADTNNFDMDINMDGGIDMDFDNFLDDILRFEEPLRQDCMWSGEPDSKPSTVISPKQSDTTQTRLSSSRLDSLLPLLNMNLDVASKDMSCFDTPLSSETSDLDETSSDLEAEAELGLRARLQPDTPSTSSPTSPQGFHFADHSYVASTSSSRQTSTDESLSITDSSEEEDKPSSPPPSSTFRVPSSRAPSFPNHRRNICLVKPSSPSTTHTTAKFKFHMKFKHGPVAPSSRSLLRSPRRSQQMQMRRTNRSPAVPFSSKSIQISQTRVLLGQQLKYSSKPPVGSTRDVRDLHNTLERQRRIDLKNAFDALRECVPDLRSRDKASKLMILTKSTEFCRGLVGSEARLRQEINRQKARHQSLVKRLRSLRTVK